MAAKVVYCSECGRKIPVFRKAVKNYGRIIDLIEPHECSEEPEELDLEPIAVPGNVEGKFKDEVDNLRPSKFPSPTENLSDRRPKDAVKSEAPDGVLQQIKGQTQSMPERPVDAAFDNEGE